MKCIGDILQYIYTMVVIASHIAVFKHVLVYISLSYYD